MAKQGGPDGHAQPAKTIIDVARLGEYVGLISKVMSPEQRVEFAEFLKDHPITMTKGKNGISHPDQQGASNFGEIANDLKRYTSQAVYQAQIPPLFTKYTSENAAFAEIHGAMWDQNVPNMEEVNATMRDFQKVAARSKAVMKVSAMDEEAIEKHFQALPEALSSQYPNATKNLLVAQDIEGDSLLGYREEQRATTTPLMKATGMEIILNSLGDGSLTTEGLRKVVKHIDNPKKLHTYDMTLHVALEAAPPLPPPPADPSKVAHIKQTHAAMKEGQSLAQMLGTGDPEIQPLDIGVLAPVSATIQTLSAARSETKAALDSAAKADISAQTEKGGQKRDGKASCVVM
jgi:hypothetical protein